MAFNPNLPAAHAPIVSQELRDQFNALKALIDVQGMNINELAQEIADLQTALNAKPSMDDVNAAITANSSANSNSVEQLNVQLSDPPTQNDVYQIIYGYNYLVSALHRQA